MKFCLKYAMLALVTVLTITGCRTYFKVTTNMDSEKDLKSYKTYAWFKDDVDTLNQAFKNEFVNIKVRDSFDSSFSIRGYVLDPDSPDVILKLTLASQTGLNKTVISFPNNHRNNPKSNSNYQFPTAYHYRHHYRYDYPPLIWIHNVRYTQSLILIQVFDSNKNEQVWSGSAKMDFYSTEHLNNEIDQLVNAIMKEYPVKPLLQKQLVLQ